MKMSVKRRTYSAREKLKVAAEALSGHITQNEITRKYQVHSTQINRWKNQLKDRAKEVFAPPNTITIREKEREKLIERLFKKVGQLEMERDWLKKKSECFD
jgi:transposase